MKNIKNKSRGSRKFSAIITKAAALLLVAVLLVGCQQKVIEEIVDQTSDAITEALELSRVNGVDIEEYVIIYPEELSDYSKTAAYYIRSQIKEKTGLSLNIQPDYVPTEAAHEIVVGETNRDISKKLDADTKNMQFSIMADENSIALEGEQFIIAAAAYFFVETYITDTYFNSTVPEGAHVHDPIQKETKNYIIMIGDGMGFNQTLLFEKYAKNISTLAPYSDGEDQFYGYLFPNQGKSQTNSLSGVTDSAAGGTALSTGYKTLNGYVGKDKTGKDIKSLTELASMLGKATAVISTDSNTGATPSSFSAHAMDRNDTETLKKSQAEGVEKYGTIISCGNNPYDKAGVNALMLKLKTTLNTLSKDSDGFFMMYEEAHIDKWCHSNEMEDTFKAVVRFNQAIGLVMEYVFYNPETFVLITADHETGGLTYGINGNFKYTQTSHSGANVPVFAYGKNAALFNGVTVENTQIPKTIAAMMGVMNFGDNDKYVSLLK